jgi:hypothetical protein
MNNNALILKYELEKKRIQINNADLILNGFNRINSMEFKINEILIYWLNGFIKDLKGV